MAISNESFSQWDAFKIKVQKMMDKGVKHFRRKDVVNALKMSKLNSEKVHEDLTEMIASYTQKYSAFVKSIDTNNVIQKYLEAWITYGIIASNIDTLFQYVNNGYVASLKRNKHDDNYIDVISINDLFIWEMFYVNWSSMLPANLIDIMTNELTNQLRLSILNQESVQATDLAIVIESLYLIMKVESSQLYDVIISRYISLTVDYYRHIAEGCVALTTQEEFVTRMFNSISYDLKKIKTLAPHSASEITSAIRNMLANDYGEYFSRLMNKFIENNQLDIIFRLAFLVWRTPFIGGFNEWYDTYVQTRFNNAKATHKNGYSLFTSYAYIMSEEESNCKVYLWDDIGIKDIIHKAGYGCVNREPCKDLALSWNILMANERDCPDFLTLAFFMILLSRNFVDNLSFEKDYLEYLKERLFYCTRYTVAIEVEIVKELFGNDFSSDIFRCKSALKRAGECLNLVNKFKRKLPKSLSYDFNVMVVRSDKLPKESSLTVPNILRQEMLQFQALYIAHNKTRKIMWRHQLSRVEVQFNNLKNIYTINMTLYLFTVLDVFNDRDSATFDEIINLVTQEKAELKQCLDFLVSKNILTFSPRSLTNKSELFLLNQDFETENKKFDLLIDHVNLPKETPKVDDASKNFYVQALLVKTMKKHRRLTRVKLLENVIEQSKDYTEVTSDFMAKCLKITIEKEYIKVAEDDPFSLVYIP